MIVRPKITKLLEKVDSRYSLVSVVAKRTRQLIDGDRETVDSKSSCKVSIAAEELAEDKIEYAKISESKDIVE